MESYFNDNENNYVLVPFYRGAVVFTNNKTKNLEDRSSRPLLSRSGCIYYNALMSMLESKGSRPLLSRSGCI